VASCPIYTDRWEAYALVLPPDQHFAAGKAEGQTNHQERWNNTLRQWLGRYTRRTLSFSKEDRYHELITRWFILEYNLSIRSSSYRTLNKRAKGRDGKTGANSLGLSYHTSTESEKSACRPSPFLSCIVICNSSLDKPCRIGVKRD
jgi:IS1 transposase